MLITDTAHIFQSFKIVPNHGAKHAFAFAMEDGHFTNAKKQCVIHEPRQHRRQFIHAHTSYIKLW